MNAKEVKERFCKLARKVMDEKFECQVCSDCFCGENGKDAEKDTYYQFEEGIMAFIEEAVAEKLANRGLYTVVLEYKIGDDTVCTPVIVVPAASPKEAAEKALAMDCDGVECDKGVIAVFEGNRKNVENGG